MSDSYHYSGSELDVFAQAANWKRYFSRQLRPYIRGDVLEVGAGMGGTTAFLRAGNDSSWTCLEPDAALAGRLSQEISEAAPAQAVPPRVVVGTTSTLPGLAAFDTLLYIDVLEHIESDGEEFQRGLSVLRPGGHLCVLSPAHRWLYTPFDKAIGHYRRYDSCSLRRLTSSGTTLIRLRYLDSVGLLASLANRIVLRSATPTRRQILFWDRCMVPVSLLTDYLFAFRLGKSVLAVWRKTPCE